MIGINPNNIGPDEEDTDDDNWRFPDGDLYYSYDLLYHTSWNWLMPVVEKIETLGLNIPIDIHWHGTYIGDRKSNHRIIGYVKGGKRLNHTYDAVVEFIKWYNEQSEE